MFASLKIVFVTVTVDFSKVDLSDIIRKKFTRCYNKIRWSNDNNSTQYLHFSAAWATSKIVLRLLNIFDEDRINNKQLSKKLYCFKNRFKLDNRFCLLFSKTNSCNWMKKRRFIKSSKAICFIFHCSITYGFKVKVLKSVKWSHIE